MTIALQTDADFKRVHQEFFSASRLGSLYGAGYTTRWQEYQILRGTIEPPDIDGALIDRGKRLQPVIRDWLAEVRPDWSVTMCQEFFPHPDIERFGAAPDMIVEAPDRPGPGAVEAKVVNGQTFREAWHEGPPLAVALQQQAQLSCTRMRWGAIAALVIGTWDWDLHIWPVERRSEAIARIEADVVAFLEDVRAGREPPADYERDGPVIAQAFAEAVGEMLVLHGDNRLPDLAGRLEKARADKKAAADIEASAKAEILHRLGTAPGAIVGDLMIEAPTVRRGAYEVKASSHRQIKTKRIVRREEPAPDLLKVAADFQAPL